MADKVYDSSNRNMNRNKKRRSKSSFEKNDLDFTTKIRIDQERLDDSDSLDTSFLEGRLGKQVKNNKKAKDRLLKEPSQNILATIPFKQIFILAFLLAFIISIIIFLPSIHFNTVSQGESAASSDVKVVEETIVDDNYVFVGDFHTEKLDFSEVSFPYVMISDKKYDTSDILDDMNGKIYQYNPSVVILELGINDLDNDVSEDEIIENVEEIIDGILENRPYAKIYVESLYPINKEVEDYDKDFLDDSIENEDISSINIKLKKLVKEKKVFYLDVYQEISEKKQLKEEYTDNGVTLNKKGSEKVFQFITESVGISS